MPKKLTKMPWDGEALLSSPRFQAFKDFQKWWFMAISFAQWNPRMPGYAEDGPNLYLLVGAHRREMWEQHKREVVAAFQRVQVDGVWYLHSPKVEALWQEQQKKYARAAERGRKGGEKISLSTIVVSSSTVDLIYQDYPRHRNPEEAKNQIRKAIQKITEKKLAEYQDRFGKTRMVPIESQLEAERFLHEAVLEFKESPEGRKPQEYIAYPERWFKRGCYLEPRGEWFVEKAGPKGKFKSMDELYGDENDNN